LKNLSKEILYFIYRKNTPRYGKERKKKKNIFYFLVSGLKKESFTKERTKEKKQKKNFYI